MEPASSDSAARVRVELGKRSYEIIIGRRLFDTAGSFLREVVEGDQVLVVCDEAVESPWSKLLTKTLATSGFDVGIISMPSGEKTKSVECIGQLWEMLADGAFARDSAMVALGGGVAGDLTGFAAATYLRGIAFVQVPTTLLAMVDSSVGGKTGVNLEQGKNLVGSFWQPAMVLADLDCLKTLPVEERISGMAEVIKYGVIRDAEFFDFLEENLDTIFQPGYDEQLVHAVKRSVEIKADVVAEDERESGLRAILNFGHTVGHAIEAETKYGKLRHGEAISIGMVVASMISLNRDTYEEWTQTEHDRLVKLLERTGLPTRVPEGLSAETLIERTQMDKKVRKGRIRYVLPVRMGEVELVRDVEAEEVAIVLKELGAS
ncbi:3-dehydroquinate synthase [bacterium]|nr:3-dehydroquinate synthase [bacterium]